MWRHLLKKSLMSDFIFCAVLVLSYAEDESLETNEQKSNSWFTFVDNSICDFLEVTRTML